MKKATSIVSCGFALVAGLSLTGACAGEAFEGSGSSGGAGTSGGAAATGGKGSVGGGKATGGALGSGGRIGAAGGVAGLGGRASGGAMGSGGSRAVGGSTSSGGAPPVNSCNNEQDCKACAYPTAPKTHDECYCPTCPSTALSSAVCTYNENAFRAQKCDTSMCPLPPCAAPQPVACDNQQCIFKMSGSRECQQNSDCTNCAYATAPQGQCVCPGCGTAMSVSRCEEFTRGYQDLGCQNVALICPAIACIQNGPAICSADGKCISDPNAMF